MNRTTCKCQGGEKKTKNNQFQDTDKKYIQQCDTKSNLRKILSWTLLSPLAFQDLKHQHHDKLCQNRPANHQDFHFSISNSLDSTKQFPINISTI